jgi:phosphatidylinositol-3-phosphatase
MPRRARAGIVVSVVAAGCLLVGCGGSGLIAAPAHSTPVAPAAAPAGGHRPAHVVVVIFENKSVAQVLRGAPYLRGLTRRAAVLTNSRALTHPSQPNYLALFSGSMQGIHHNGCFAPLANRANLGRQLLNTGHSFVGYAEGLPHPGFTGCVAGRYAAKHNPWVHFANLPPWTNQPFAAFPRNFAALPTVAFVVPDMCNDMHDCSVGTGDRWARRHLDPYLRWADAHNSLLIVTFDEDNGSSGNRIFTVIAGAGVRSGGYGERVDHYRVLRTIEHWYGLPALGAAAARAPITDIWFAG